MIGSDPGAWRSADAHTEQAQVVPDHNRRRHDDDDRAEATVYSRYTPRVLPLRRAVPGCGPSPIAIRSIVLLTRRAILRRNKQRNNPAKTIGIDGQARAMTNASAAGDVAVVAERGSPRSERLK